MASKSSNSTHINTVIAVLAKRKTQQKRVPTCEWGRENNNNNNKKAPKEFKICGEIKHDF